MQLLNHLNAFKWLCVMLLLGCASSATIREYLDPDTATTVSVAKGEWIFARDRTDLAMHARDYITLTPVQSNRNGQRVLYLHCQIWSTIDRRDGGAIIDKRAPLSLVANDRKIALTNDTHTARELGFQKSPVELANARAEVHWVAIDVATLRYLLQAKQLRISTGDEADAFEQWRDQRAGIAAFLQHISAL